MRRKVTLIPLFVIVIVAIMVLYMKGYLSAEQTLLRIINEEGYTLHAQDKDLSFEMPVREEWIPDQEGENTINVLIKDQYDTEIILRSVRLRGDSISFDFEARTHTAKNRESGVFLYIEEIVRKGSSVSQSQRLEWMFYDKNGVDLLYGSKEIKGHSSGAGPGNQFSVSLDKKYMKLIQEGMIIKLSGFVLYRYSQ